VVSIDTKNLIDRFHEAVEAERCSLDRDVKKSKNQSVAGENHLNLEVTYMKLVEFNGSSRVPICGTALLEPQIRNFLPHLMKRIRCFRIVELKHGCPSLLAATVAVC
jgi:hypothetical protein